jgi:hypothetical protein
LSSREDLGESWEDEKVAGRWTWIGSWLGEDLMTSKPVEQKAPRCPTKVPKADIRTGETESYAAVAGIVVKMAQM